MRKGKAGFHTYYQELFGDRWPALQSAMAGEPAYYPLEEGLLESYYLDEASWYAALSLEPATGRRMLDLCAAPGGKSLALASQMPKDATLVTNERSATRRGRLRTVLDNHLPPDTRDRVTVTGHDARVWGLHEKNTYDRVLADVPCSSERHVLGSESHLAQWGPSRSKRLAVQATAILAAAVDAAAPGGLIVYATCALLEVENDAVVRRVLDRRHGVVELRPVTLPFGVRTEFGIHVLPDRDGGRGPMYVAGFRKINESP